MPKRNTPEVVALSLLAAGEVPNFLAGMMPSLMTITRFGADEVDRAALRRGELAGLALSMMVATGASLAAESWWPFITAAAVAGVLVVMYEHALANPHPSAAPIDAQPMNG